MLPAVSSRPFPIPQLALVVAVAVATGASPAVAVAQPHGPAAPTHAAPTPGAAVAAAVAGPGTTGHAVAVSDAWVRGTVPGQRATGAFMTLRTPADATLMSVTSPVAGVVELHEMALAGGVMRMRSVDAGIVLPAGRPVTLAPGGLHVMLMDLKQPFTPGSRVPLALHLRHADGRRQTLQVDAPVRALNETRAAHGH